MRNGFETTLKVTRIEICDLMLACLTAQAQANDGGAKWAKLHDSLKAQLDAMDAQLDALIAEEA